MSRSMFPQVSPERVVPSASPLPRPAAETSVHMKPPQRTSTGERLWAEHSWTSRNLSVPGNRARSTRSQNSSISTLQDTRAGSSASAKAASSPMSRPPIPVKSEPMVIMGSSAAT